MTRTGAVWTVRRWLGVALSLVVAATAVWQASVFLRWSQQTGPLPGHGVELMPGVRSRASAVAQVLEPGGTAGYVSSLGEQRVEDAVRLTLMQYELAPLTLIRCWDQQVVIADLDTDRQVSELIELGRFQQVLPLGPGLAILLREESPR